jgi:hypothetical protein
MTAENIAVVTGAVVALTQLAKFLGVGDRRGPLVVLVFAALGVVLWAVSFERGFDRALLWPYFAGWIVTATSAAGVYGFSRSIPEAVTRASPPPPGAGGAPTGRMFGAP